MMAAAQATGIPQLDALLAPIPDHSAIVIMNDPGLEAEAFLYQAADARMRSGGKVVYVVTNRAPSSVVETMRDFGFDPSDRSERLLFVDAFSALMGGQEDVPYHVRDPKDAREVVSALERAAKDHPDALLLIDGLSTVIDNTSVKEFAKVFPKLEKAVRQFALSTVLFTRWGYGPEVDEMLGSLDAILEVRGVEDRITFGQYFNLQRASWLKQPDTRPRLFKTIRPGGVFVYVPKIVVTGPHNAGKSNFIHAVSDSAVSVDRLGTTVTMDHGKVQLAGIAADLFGTPGQERFDAALRTIAGQALGVIILVDSTRPESFDRARKMMEQTWRDGLPAVIAANKQDVPNALSPDEVAKRIQPPPNVPVIGCVGQDRASGRKVLEQLLNQILAGVAA